MRHTQAVPKAENPARPLSHVGTQTAQKVGKFLQKHFQPHIDVIYHSHKLRAKETALAIRGELQISSKIEEVEGLEPLDPPNIWMENLQTIEHEVMIVTHLPYIGKLTSLLLEPAGNQQKIEFNYGTCICLERYAPNHWVIAYEFTPE